MKRIIVTSVALISSGAGSPANEQNQKLLALSQPERHAALFAYVRKSGEDCDEIIRSALRHDVAGEPAFWNVGCRNKKSYWVVIVPDSADLAMVADCKTDKVLGKMLADRARRDGKLPKQAACWK
jgi:hypothetical protein